MIKLLKNYTIKENNIYCWLKHINKFMNRILLINFIIMINIKSVLNNCIFI